MVGVDSGGILVDNDSIKINENGQAYVNGALVPIGGVIAWLKSYTNTPALDGRFVECNGQTLDDSESVYDTQTIPDLNGNSYFLMGSSTSGTTGGAGSFSVTEGNQTSGGADSVARINGLTGNHNVSILPPHYGVVWVMRIK